MKKKVEILCILDRSGSMSSIMNEAIAAFNEFADQQKKLPGKAKLTLVSFDNEYQVVFDRVKLKDLRELTIDDVQPRGMTALNDAIGRAVSSIKSKDAICLIQTDGHENASQEYTVNQVKELLDVKKKEGWDISFIGAGIDAFKSGEGYGISHAKCLSVAKTGAGMRAFTAYSTSTSKAYREDSD